MGNSRVEGGINKSVLPKDTTQSLWPALKPGLLDPESNAQLNRRPKVYTTNNYNIINVSKLYVYLYVE